MNDLTPEDQELIRIFLERLFDGTTCVHCGQQVTRFVQVGRAYYAEPCGHRQGQGRAAYFNKKIAAKEAEQNP